MFGNLIKLALFAVIIAAVALFARDRLQPPGTTAMPTAPAKPEIGVRPAPPPPSPAAAATSEARPEPAPPAVPEAVSTPAIETTATEPPPATTSLSPGATSETMQNIAGEVTTASENPSGATASAGLVTAETAPPVTTLSPSEAQKLLDEASAKREAAMSQAKMAVDAEAAKGTSAAPVPPQAQ